MTNGNPDEFRRNRNLIHQARFEKRLFNLLCLYSFLRPRITNTNAELEHEAAQNILTLVATMRENSNRARTVDAGARELADFNIHPIGRAALPSGVPWQWQRQAQRGYLVAANCASRSCGAAWLV